MKLDALDRQIQQSGAFVSAQGGATPLCPSCLQATGFRAVVGRVRGRLVVGLTCKTCGHRMAVIAEEAPHGAQ
jgi:hypothetical protein